MSHQYIPFAVDTSRILELLAKQIYQSPLALLSPTLSRTSKRPTHCRTATVCRISTRRRLSREVTSQARLSF